eukprot:gene834-biopygen10708
MKVPPVKSPSKGVKAPSKGSKLYPRRVSGNIPCSWHSLPGRTNSCCGLHIGMRGVAAILPDLVALLPACVWAFGICCRQSQGGLGKPSKSAAEPNECFVTPFARFCAPR